MNWIRVFWLMIAALALLMTFSACHSADMSLTETRYCGVIRDAKGHTSRSRMVIAAFKRAHPCPVNGHTSGACPGWAIDHVVSLDCGGCDSVSNMQWLPDTIKSCAGSQCKDRWERRVYYSPTICATKGCHA